MTNIVRFDDHHPSFQDTAEPIGSPPSFEAEIFSGGRYVGSVRFRRKAVAWGHDYDVIGQFDTVDSAVLDLLSRATA